MEDIVVGEETVLKHFAKLKVDKFPGLDKLHPRLLVEVRNEIKKPLSILFNQSINSKSLPNDWKKSSDKCHFQKREQITSKKLQAC